MILDFLTVLFFVAGLLLIYRMLRQRRRDVLHGKYLKRPDSSSHPKKPT